MKKIFLLGSFFKLLFVMTALPVWGQVNLDGIYLSQEALLFGQTEASGSARIQAMGGAQVSLGGDISSILSNPAGLGFYNRSEVSFSPSFAFNRNTGQYLGNGNNDFNYNLDFQNLGLVLTTSRNYSPNALWKGASFGISYSRTADYNKHFKIGGKNNQSTILNFFLQQAEGYSVDDITAVNDFLNLAYETYLINPAGDYQYAPPSDNIGLITEQNETIERSGSQDQWNLSYGGNFDDFLYFGVGVGLTSVEYREKKNYSEYFQSGDIIEILYDSDLRITGSGLNATLGMIARPNDHLNLGVTFVTPTLYTLRRENNNDLEAIYDDLLYEEPDTSYTLNNREGQGDNFVSEYSMTSPLKLKTGMTYFLGKRGFLTSDLEFVDYGSMRLTSNDFDTERINRNISDKYTSVLNWKIGGEYRYNVFRLRGGFAYNGDPYKADDQKLTSQNYSVGAGIKLPSYFIDLTLIHGRSQMDYSPYHMDTKYIGEEIDPYTITPQATITTARTQALVSFGWYF